MKTSNKIFIGLLTTIFMVIMAIFIDIRVFGIHRSERFASAKTENISIGDFHHLRVEGSFRLNVAPSDKNLIQFQHFSDTIKSFINHKVVDDTLIITGQKSEIFYVYTLLCLNQIKSITLNSSSLQLDGIVQDSIVFNIKDGEVNGYRSNERKDSHFKMAKFSMRDSRINLYSIRVDTLVMDMLLSNARIETDVQKIHASLKSDSELNLRKVSSLDIDKDESSTLRIY